MKDDEQAQDPGRMTREDFAREVAKLIDLRASSLSEMVHEISTEAGIGTGRFWAKGPEKDSDDGKVATRTAVIVLSSEMTLEEIQILEKAYDQVTARISSRTEEIKIKDRSVPTEAKAE